jgi:hypothetical protein
MDAQGRTRPGLIAAALLYGAVWGLGEATLGHLLHLLRVPGLPGLVMIPFAALILGLAAVRSRSAAAVFLAGVVAASFKLLDLFVPGTDLPALSRPIQAILLEALAAAALVGILGRARGTVPVRGRSPKTLTIERLSIRRKGPSGNPGPDL